MAEEHLVVGTGVMVTTDEVRTMKTVMTDGVTDRHGTPGIITRRVGIGDNRGSPCPKKSKLHAKSQHTPK